MTTIGIAAFGECKSLVSIYISEKCKSIGDNAFVNCKSLTDVTISEKTTQFGNYDFSGSPWGDNRIARDLEKFRKEKGVCLYCGGEFKGIVQKKCVKCGRRKDY